jgi:hypothetical protein
VALSRAHPDGLDLPDLAARKSSDPIPFFSRAETSDRLWPLIADRVNAVFDNGKFSRGPHVAEFERLSAEYTGARDSVFFRRSCSKRTAR